jgi:hypothetical protein
LVDTEHGAELVDTVDRVPVPEREAGEEKMIKKGRERHK